MSRLGRTLLLSSLLLAPAVPVPAHAQEPSPDAEDLVLRAMAEVEEGRLEEAVALLEPVRERVDTPPQALALLGALYLEVDRPEGALGVLQALAEREDADPAVLYNAGRAALAVGDIVRAQAYLERSVALESGTPAARELGLLYGLQGRIRDAYRLLLPWSRRFPEDVEARQAAAMTALRLKRVPQAEELLSDLPQDDPGVRVLWANLLLLKGEPHGAVEMLRPLVEAPEDALPAEVRGDARRMLAEAYLEVGEAEKTVSLLEGHATGPGVAQLLARGHYQSGDLEAALETLTPFAEPLLEAEIDRADPRWVVAEEILREYGSWLATAGRHQDALPYLRRASEVRPDQKQTWQALAQALAATGQPEEAREALARFQELVAEEEPASTQIQRLRTAREDPTAREITRAVELIAQGRLEEALEVVRAEGELAPADPRLRLLESRILLLIERPAEALVAAEAALALAPDDPDAVYQRGTAHMAASKLTAAEADFRRALEIAPDHVPALNDLAVVLLVGGEREEARSLLERVLELRPEDPRALETLERLDGSQGS